MDVVFVSRSLYNQVRVLMHCRLIWLFTFHAALIILLNKHQTQLLMTSKSSSDSPPPPSTGHTSHLTSYYRTTHGCVSFPVHYITKFLFWCIVNRHVCLPVHEALKIFTGQTTINRHDRVDGLSGFLRALWVRSSFPLSTGVHLRAPCPGATSHSFWSFVKNLGLISQRI